MSRQLLFCAGAQKSTCPEVTGLPPAVTVAVRVTSVPWLTRVTATPFAVNASVVVVAVWLEAFMVASPRSSIDRQKTARGRLAIGRRIIQVSTDRQRCAHSRGVAKVGQSVG